MIQANQVLIKTANSVDAARGDESEGERQLNAFVRLRFALVRGFLWGWASLFSLKGLYLLGQAFGTLEYWTNFRRRTRYRQAIKRIYPEGLDQRTIRNYTRSYFRRTRCDKMYYLIFDKLPREKLLRRFRFQGREHFDEALERGAGMYLMASHNGSHYVLGQLIALLGYQIAGLRDRNEGVARTYIQQKMAETFPQIAECFRMYFADSYPRLIYRHFQNNQMIGSALDVNRSRGGNLKTCPVTIFGEQREFLTGTLQIALRCRAMIAQIFIVSRPNFYFRMIVKPMFFPDLEADEKLDSPERIADLMQMYADGIEAHVREHPDHLSRI